MCEYTGDVKDPQCYIDIQLTDVEITECVKKMQDEPVAECSKTGLRPFCALNKPPAVRIAFFRFNLPSLTFADSLSIYLCGAMIRFGRGNRRTNRPNHKTNR